MSPRASKGKVRVVQFLGNNSYWSFIGDFTSLKEAVEQFVNPLNLREPRPGYGYYAFDDKGGRLTIETPIEPHQTIMRQAA